MSIPFKFTPIILRLTDTDLYKFTMWQALLHAFPMNTAVYRFVCRNKPLIPLATLVDEVNRQLDHLCTLRFQADELQDLALRGYAKPDFVQFLRLFQLNRDFISARAVGDDLEIVADGPQVHVMPFEIYVLEIVNEVYFRALGGDHLAEGRRRLMAKIQLVRQEMAVRPKMATPFEFFDFGSRRRYSAAWHEEVVATLQAELPEHFRGTSNVNLARKYNLTPMGTMAHEYLQTFQAVGVQLKQFQKAALEAWVQEYRGNLGIALTDVVGMDAFLADFDLYLAKLYDGMRHDSGDAVVWGEKAIAHYKMLRIATLTKRLVFSDGLDMGKSLYLHFHFGDRIQQGYGIGTNLSNDVGLEPLSLVMKLVNCNGQPVAKLPDSEGKTICDDPKYLSYLGHVFNRPIGALVTSED